jgi:hypothetical protein
MIVVGVSREESQSSIRASEAAPSPCGCFREARVAPSAVELLAQVALELTLAARVRADSSNFDSSLFPFEEMAFVFLSNSCRRYAMATGGV